MQKKMSFVGIGIELGQEKKGLSISSKFARTYLREIAEFSDYGDILSNVQGHKVFDYEHLSGADLNSYVKATKVISAALENHDFHLNWGGDHSIGWATISAFLGRYPNGKVVWIDAHADLNKPDTSATGNLHGMPLSFLLGLNSFDEPLELSNRLKPDQLIYVGLRSLDPFEKVMIQKLQIPTFDMNFINKWGIAEACKQIKSLVCDSPAHISFDIDSLDPVIAPSTGVPVENGLNLEQLKFLGEFLSKQTEYKSLDIVEINPLIGNLREVELTYNLAFSFLNEFIPHKTRGKDAFKSSSIKRKFPVAPKRSLSISAKDSIQT